MIMTLPPKPRRPARAGASRIVLHLPVEKKPGSRDFSLAGAALFLAGLAVYLSTRLPAPEAPFEDTLEWMDVPPPPVTVEEPPKPAPPPERTPPPMARTEAPPPVFGLQEEETSASGDMASATGNTLAAPPDSIVQAAPPPLPAAPVELDRPPGFLKQVSAEYPEWAQDQGVEAVVLVWVTIDAAGRVTDATVKRGAGEGFDSGALRAARASLFQPLVKDGAKLPSRFVVTYDFKLEG